MFKMDVRTFWFWL